MPPYLRRRIFRGWDWFTPREIQHLPWQEQERLVRAAREIVRRHRRKRLVMRLAPLLNLLLAILVMIGLLSHISFFFILLIFSVQIAVSIGSMIWQRKFFREALQQMLLDAGLRPHFCFDCGYRLDGYEGTECPACDALLLRPADSPRTMP